MVNPKDTALYSNVMGSGYEYDKNRSKKDRNFMYRDSYIQEWCGSFSMKERISLKYILSPILKEKKK